MMATAAQSLIKIKHNKECYEITHESSRGVADIAFADYKSSIEEHVGNIYEVLASLGIKVELEKM